MQVGRILFECKQDPEMAQDANRIEGILRRGGNDADNWDADAVLADLSTAQLQIRLQEEQLFGNLKKKATTPGTYATKALQAQEQRIKNIEVLLAESIGSKPQQGTASSASEASNGKSGNESAAAAAPAASQPPLNYCRYFWNGICPYDNCSYPHVARPAGAAKVCTKCGLSGHDEVHCPIPAHNNKKTTAREETARAMIQSLIEDDSTVQDLVTVAVGHATP